VCVRWSPRSPPTREDKTVGNGQLPSPSNISVSARRQVTSTSTPFSFSFAFAFVEIICRIRTKNLRLGWHRPDAVATESSHGNLILLSYLLNSESVLTWLSVSSRPQILHRPQYHPRIRTDTSLATRQEYHPRIRAVTRPSSPKLAWLALPCQMVRVCSAQ
jgi:hypothetical protein